MDRKIEIEFLEKTIEALSEGALEIFFISEEMDQYTLPDPHLSYLDCVQYYPQWFKDAYVMRGKMRQLETTLKELLKTFPK